MKIINEDMFYTDAIEDGSIDLIVTSPPYNLEIDYNRHYDKMQANDYKEFLVCMLSQMRRWLKDDGRLCLNTPINVNKDGASPLGAEVTHMARQLDFGYHTTIIWNKQTMNKRTAWGSWMSASAPYVIPQAEQILVLYKEHWKKQRDSLSTISKKDFVEWTNGMWEFAPESGQRIGHPAPFPLALPMRCIQLFSYVDDTVLDPFLGSGTTLVACQKTGRDGIGIEISKEYCDLATERTRQLTMRL